MIETIKAEPWPFIAGGIVVVAMILSEFFGKVDGTSLDSLTLTLAATEKPVPDGANVLVNYAVFAAKAALDRPAFPL